MTEEQLRDVLARVVPEAPDSVADPGPVVRAARTRRRAQVALAGGAVAVIAVAAVVGGRALTDADPGPQVAEEPSLSGDPYSAASCPAVLPASDKLPDLSEVTAVRYCAAGFNGFPAQAGPQDALLSGLGDLATAVAAIPVADPARCAAVDVIPSDSRLAFELADGTVTFVPATMCTDIATADGNLDGADVTQAFLTVLDAQRDDFGYEASSVDVGCDDQSSAGPVRPGRDQLVSAMVCGSDTGVEVVGDQFKALDEAWSTATQDPGGPCAQEGDYYSIVAGTDRGDVVRLDVDPCGFAQYFGWQSDEPAYGFVTPDELSGS